MQKKPNLSKGGIKRIQMPIKYLKLLRSILLIEMSDFQNIYGNHLVDKYKGYLKDIKLIIDFYL